MKSTLKKLLFCIFLPLFILCGGGSDVGNPDITGVVSYSGNVTADNAMVIMGKAGAAGIVDTTYTSGSDELSICFTLKYFDTTYTDNNGQFTFEAVPPGSYVLLASKNNLLGICKVDHSIYEYSETDLLLEPSVALTVHSQYLYTDTTSLKTKFAAARIEGTPITAAPDSSGIINFYAVPAGDLNVLLYVNDGTIRDFTNLETQYGCGAQLDADPLLAESYWTPRDCGPRHDIDRPYVLWSSPSDGAKGAQVTENLVKTYDIAVQFSHPMDTRLTANAISVFSSDSTVSKDSIWWDGNEMYITLCEKDDQGQCSRTDSLFKTGINYSVVIDTTARTAFGVNFSHPDTINFAP